MPEKPRLNQEEAQEDIERFNKAAEEEGLPKANEYSRLDDVKAAEEMLQEGGKYDPVDPAKLVSPRNYINIDKLFSEIRRNKTEEAEMADKAKNFLQEKIEEIIGSLGVDPRNLSKEELLESTSQRVKMPKGVRTTFSEPKPHDHGWISGPVTSGGVGIDPQPYRAAAIYAAHMALFEFDGLKLKPPHHPYMEKLAEHLAKAIRYLAEAEIARVKGEIAAAINSGASEEKRRELYKEEQSLERGDLAEARFKAELKKAVGLEESPHKK